MLYSELPKSIQYSIKLYSIKFRQIVKSKIENHPISSKMFTLNNVNKTIVPHNISYTYNLTTSTKLLIFAYLKIMK